MTKRLLFVLVIFEIFLIFFGAWMWHNADAASQSVPQALTAPGGVSLSGPLSGVVSASYTFTATTNSGTQPLSYTWEADGQLPVTHTGAGLSDIATFRWNTSGPKLITVTVANAWGQTTGSHLIELAHPPLDIALIFDVSGSMIYETNCFGCWNEDPQKSADIMSHPYPTNGNFNPLDYAPPLAGGGPYNIFWGGNAGDFGNPALAGHAVCNAAPAPLVYTDGYHYSVHEAEFYARDYPLHGWEFDQRIPGQGFWVIQRLNRGSNNTYIRAHPFSTYSQSSLSNYPQLQGAAYNAECFDPSGNLSGECWKTRATIIGEPAPSNLPFVEYDFTVDWANLPPNKTHIWVRAIGGSSWSFEWYGQTAQQLNAWSKSIYFQVDNNPAFGGPFNSLRSQGNSLEIVSDDDWRWVKIAKNLNLANGQHTLRVYQGSSGFNLDKIIITNNSVDNVGETRANWFFDGATGPDATPGSATREACNMCNPAFGQIVDPAQCSCKTGPGDTVVGSYPGGGSGIGCAAVLTTTNQLANDLFYDVAPLRHAQEAAKHLANQLDPQLDQLGLVAFSSNIQARTKLQCLRYAEVGHAGTGGEAKCWDPGTNPISYTYVIQTVEDRSAAGATNTAQGIREGLEELGVEIPVYNTGVTSECSSVDDDKKSCDRGGTTQRVLILLTDGIPNNNVNCPLDYIWNGNIGPADRNFACALYYAEQAAANNVAMFAVGIGPGVYPDLLAAIATGADPGAGDVYFEQSCGQYFQASKPNNLPAVMDQILGLARNCAQSSISQTKIYLPVVLKE